MREVAAATALGILVAVAAAIPTARAALPVREARLPPDGPLSGALTRHVGPW